MINIQIADSPPELSVDQKLMTELSVFNFDTERYIAGLALAEVPKQTIDFKKSDILFASPITYSDNEHRIEAMVTNSPRDRLQSIPTWINVVLTESSIINYGLAHSAKVMSDQWHRRYTIYKLIF